MTRNRSTPFHRAPAMTSLALALSLAIPYSASAQSAPQDAAVVEELQALRAQQAQIAQMQQQNEARIQALEARLGVAAPAVATTTAAAQPASTSATTASASAAPSAASNASRLKISGDLRVRAQGDYSDSDGKNRNSSQLRARLGATYAASDLVTIGARLATGDADDPNSSDVQLSNFDDDLDVSLDQAWVQLNLGDAKVYAGKMPQPFTRTELVWDGDVSPQGLAATYRRALSGGAAFRANGLFFVVDEQAGGSDSTMWGGQVGLDSPSLGRWKLDGSLAYYDYDLGSVAGADSGDFRSNLRNPDGSYRSDFNLADVIVGATWQGANEKLPVRIVGDYVHNLGAETSADTGYGVDVSLGRVSAQHDWRLTYGYAMAETDAVLAAFSQDNIGIGTNYRMHALTFDYVPLPKTMISAIWYHYKPYSAVDAGSNDPGDWLDRFRVAFLVNF